MFKIGDTVRPKLELIKWYLSDEGQNIFWPASGVLDAHQEYSLDNANIAMLSLLLDKDLSGKIVAHHHPNSTSENFKVEILSTTFNIEPKNLVRKRNV